LLQKSVAFGVSMATELCDSDRTSVLDPFGDLAENRPIVYSGPYAPPWAMPMMILRAKVAGAAMGFVSALCNLGGFRGSLCRWLRAHVDRHDIDLAGNYIAHGQRIAARVR